MVMFFIVDFELLYVSQLILHGVYISQHILFAGMSSLVTVFYARNKILIAELSVS